MQQLITEIENEGPNAEKLLILNNLKEEQIELLNYYKEDLPQYDRYINSHPQTPALKDGMLTKEMEQ
jgi:hypothetical protein